MKTADQLIQEVTNEINFEKKELELENLIRKLIKIFEFLFISLSIGVFIKWALGWKLAEIIVDSSIVAFTLMLVFIVYKMNKKQKKDEMEHGD